MVGVIPSLLLMEWMAFPVLNLRKEKGLFAFMGESLFVPPLSLKIF
jgi:hypothetical protein